jgi:hypothetical protein
VRSAIAVLAAVVACLLAAPGASAAPPFTGQCGLQLCGWISEDGSRAVFPFYEELTPRAARAQVYERAGGTTRALVPYPSDPPDPTYAAPLGISADARHVFVWTNLALDPGDADGNTSDVYDISKGGAQLISTGPLDDQSSLDSAPVAPFMPTFAGASAGGSRVFLWSMRPIVPEDTDGCPDVYERSAGVTTLVSTGPTASASFPWPQCDLAVFRGISADDSHVFFSTYDQLVAGDDGGDDVYQRVGGQVSLVTDYQGYDDGCVDTPKFGDSSADGATVLFATNMPIDPGDDDVTMDVYKREPDGRFVLVSAGSEGKPPGAGCGMFDGDSPIAISADGRTSIYETAADLGDADPDTTTDIYSVTDGSGPVLVTTGGATPTQRGGAAGRWTTDVSDDASRVAFETDSALVQADTDEATDVYLRSPGRTELVSTGPDSRDAALDAALIGISGDGTTVGFATRERLTGEDFDRAPDIYVRHVDVSGGVSGRAGASKLSRAKRTVLVSAEAIAPRMSIKSGRLIGSRVVKLRIGCPKAEKSGPCHGVAAAKHGRASGRVAFKVRPGLVRAVALRLSRPIDDRTPRVATRVRGVDRLGNARTVRRSLVLGSARR